MSGAGSFKVRMSRWGPWSKGSRDISLLRHTLLPDMAGGSADLRSLRKAPEGAGRGGGHLSPTEGLRPAFNACRQGHNLRHWLSFPALWVDVLGFGWMAKGITPFLGDVPEIGFKVSRLHYNTLNQVVNLARRRARGLSGVNVRAAYLPFHF